MVCFVWHASELEDLNMAITVKVTSSPNIKAENICKRQFRALMEFERVAASYVGL